MQNHIKERVLGSTILLGGGILLSAMLFRTDDAVPEKQADTVVVSETEVQKNNRSTAEELTVDYETEQKILAQKREARAKQIAEREKAINALLKAQDAARLAALEKAEEEHGVDETVTLQPEYTKEQIQQQEQRRAKTKQMIANAQAESARLKKLQAEKAALEAQQREDERKLEQARIAEERQRNQREQLRKEKTLAAAKQKKNDAESVKKNEQNYVAARNELKDARKKSTDNKKYAVQVALAANQENADIMASNLRKYGYRVTTSKTSRGVRVVVGPEKGQGAAYALRKKLKSDKRVNVNDGWVAAYDRVHSKADAKAERERLRLKAENRAKKAQAKKEQVKKEKQIQAEKKKAATKNDDKPKEDKYHYGVQVAMAGDSESRDALIAKLKKNGYTVKTSNTSRGTRIIVGGGQTKAQARKLQQKVNSDSRIGISGAWIKRERKKK